MISSTGLVRFSIALAALLAVISVLRGDWMWFVVDIFSVAVLVLPYRRNLGYYYSQDVLIATLLAPVFMAALFIVDATEVPLRSYEFLDISVYEYFVAAIQAFQCFVTGIMIALILNMTGVVRMSRAWVMLFATAFAVSVSAVDMLFSFLQMYMDGEPVFNEDFVGEGARYTNRFLMITPVTAAFSTAAYAAIFYLFGDRDHSNHLLNPDGTPATPAEVEEHEAQVATGEVRAWGIDDAICIVSSAVLFALSIAELGDDPVYARKGIFCAVLCLLPLALKHLKVVRLPTAMVLIVCLAAFLHGFGLVTHMYDTAPNYDTMTHTLSSLTVGICVFYVLTCYQVYSGGKVGFSGNGLALMTGLLALAFSTYWEVIEFSSDILTGSHTQYSPYDTLTDMVCDTTGMLIASFWIGIHMRKHTPSELVASFRLNERLLRFISK